MLTAIIVIFALLPLVLALSTYSSFTPIFRRTFYRDSFWRISFWSKLFGWASFFLFFSCFLLILNTAELVKDDSSNKQIEDDKSAKKTELAKDIGFSNKQKENESDTKNNQQDYEILLRNVLKLNLAACLMIVFSSFINIKEVKYNSYIPLGKIRHFKFGLMIILFRCILVFLSFSFIWGLSLKLPILEPAFGLLSFVFLYPFLLIFKNNPIFLEDRKTKRFFKIKNLIINCLLLPFVVLKFLSLLSISDGKASSNEVVVNENGNSQDGSLNEASDSDKDKQTSKDSSNKVAIDENGNSQDGSLNEASDSDKDEQASKISKNINSSLSLNAKNYLSYLKLLDLITLFLELALTLIAAIIPLIHKILPWLLSKQNEYGRGKYHLRSGDEVVFTKFAGKAHFIFKKRYRKSLILENSKGEEIQVDNPGSSIKKLVKLSLVSYPICIDLKTWKGFRVGAFSLKKEPCLKETKSASRFLRALLCAGVLLKLLCKKLRFRKVIKVFMRPKKLPMNEIKNIVLNGVAAFLTSKDKDKEHFPNHPESFFVIRKKAFSWKMELVAVTWKHYNIDDLHKEKKALTEEIISELESEEGIRVLNKELIKESEYLLGLEDKKKSNDTDKKKSNDAELLTEMKKKRGKGLDLQKINHPP